MRNSHGLPRNDAAPSADSLPHFAAGPCVIQRTDGFMAQTYKK